MNVLSFYEQGPDDSARRQDDTPLIDVVNVVDYGGFVDLVVEQEPAQSG